MSEAIAGIIGALIGAIAALVTARSEYRQKGDELFFEALGFLDGGTQKRNLGISALELYWMEKRHRHVAIPLLTGSALYLLLQSKQDDAPHEIFNLKRIMVLLLGDSGNAATSPQAYAALHQGLQEKIQVGDERGLRISRPLVESWCETLNHWGNTRGHP